MIADEKDLPVDPTIDSPKKPCKCGSNDFLPERDVLDTWANTWLTSDTTSLRLLIHKNLIEKEKRLQIINKTVQDEEMKQALISTDEELEEEIENDLEDLM